MREIPTAPVAAGSLIAGYAVAVASGSRPLGGAVLAAGGVWCAHAWWRRQSPRTALALSAAGLAAFALSHVLALALGAWPSVLLVSAAMAALAWTCADAPSRALAEVPARATSADARAHRIAWRRGERGAARGRRPAAALFAGARVRARVLAQQG